MRKKTSMFAIAVVLSGLTKSDGQSINARASNSDRYAVEVPGARVATSRKTLAAVSPALLQPANEPRKDFFVPNGGIFTLLQTNGVLFVGGGFDYIGPHLGSGVIVDLASGFPEFPTPEVFGSIRAVLADGRGGWFIGGDFASVGDIAQSNLVHFLADRTVDQTENVNADRPVLSIALSGGIVYLGGEFSTIGGKIRNRLAAIDGFTGRVTDWKPDLSGAARVSSLAVSADTVYIAYSTGGLDADRLAAFEVGTGRLTAWKPNPVPAPRTAYKTLAVGCGKVFIGGEFTNFDGQTRSSLVAVDAAGGFLVSSADLNIPGDVKFLSVSAETLYVGGAFKSVGGQAHNSIAAIDIATDKVLPWDPNPDVDGKVFAMAVSDNTVYVSGSFQNIGGRPRNGLAALDGATAEATAWNPSINDLNVRGFIGTFGISEESLFAVGTTSLKGYPRKNLAAFEVRTGAVLDWNPEADFPVDTMIMAGNAIYVGGRFNSIGGKPRNRIAALDAQTGAVTDWDPNVLGDRVSVMGISSGTLFAGGSFTNAGGSKHFNFVGLDLVTGRARPWNLDVALTSFSALVQSLAVGDSLLYVGGVFDSIGGVSRKNLAAVDAVSGAIADWKADPNDGVLAMALSDSALYVGGRFTTIAGQPRTQVAVLDTASGNLISWKPNIQGQVFSTYVTALTALGNTIYVGGNFASVNGVSRQNLAAIDSLSAQLGPWSGVANGINWIWTMAAFADGVYASGSRIGGDARSFAVFPPEGMPFVVNQPLKQTVTAGQTVSFSATAKGREPLFYQWRLNGTDLPGATNALLVIPNATVANSGQYQVVITNEIGLVRSAEAVLLAFVPPALDVQPLGQRAGPGADVRFTVSATGVPPPTYQWRLNGVNIAGARQSSFRITNAQPTLGGVYSVAVANIGGTVSSDAAELIVTSPSLLLADNFQDRVVTNSFAGAGSGSNSTASREIGEPNHAGKPGSKSVWYSWRAPTNGIVTFSTRGSAFDTVLAVYTNAAGNATSGFSSLREIASDDDRGGFLTSEVVFNTIAGTEYVIAIDGFGKSSGSIVLSWNLEAGLSEVPRIFQQPLSQTVAAGENVNFSVTAFSARPLSYQWIYNCLPVLGATNAQLAVTNVQATQVGSYSVRVNNGQREVESLTAFLQINFSGDAGTVQKVASRDKLADRTIVGQAFSLAAAAAEEVPMHFKAGLGGSIARGFSGTQIFNTFNATKEPGETNHCGIAGGASAWYSILAEETGLMQVSTEGSEFDTVLAVYAGPENPLEFDELTFVACGNNSGADRQTSRLTFSAVRNQVYHIAVDGVNGASGRVQLSYRLNSLRVDSGVMGFTNGAFRMRWNGLAMKPVVIEASTNLLQWLPIQTNATPAATWDFLDADSARHVRRFYRAIQ
jgi:hypothetical protein